ncbi:unnamed protein product [Merluccius merluccius]
MTGPGSRPTASRRGTRAQDCQSSETGFCRDPGQTQYRCGGLTQISKASLDSTRRRAPVRLAPPLQQLNGGPVGALLPSLCDSPGDCDPSTGDCIPGSGGCSTRLVLAAVVLTLESAHDEDSHAEDGSMWRQVMKNGGQADGETLDPSSNTCPAAASATAGARDQGEGTDGWRNGQLDGWRYGGTDGGIDGWMDRRTDGQTDGRAELLSGLLSSPLSDKRPTR